MSKMRVFMWLMLYISVSFCLFLLLKWPGPGKNNNPVDVFMTLLLAVPVLYLIQVLPPKQAITSFLTKVHAMWGNWFIDIFLLIPGAVAHLLMMNHPERIELWFASSFLLALVCFLVLHATPQVSCSVCRSLNLQICGLVFVDLLKRDFLSAFASGVTSFVCFIVMGTKFGGAA